MTQETYRAAAEQHGRTIAEIALRVAGPASGKLRDSCEKWLITRLTQGDLDPDDFEQAEKLLGVFSRHKNDLPKWKRDLFQCSDLYDLRRILRAHLPFGEIRRDFRQAGQVATWYGQNYLWLHDDAHLKVFIPLSQKAATAVGKATDWCIAHANEPNHFWRYALYGPLIHVFTSADGKSFDKYCIHMATGQYQNAFNKTLRRRQILTLSPHLSGLLEPYLEPAVLAPQEPQNASNPNARAVELIAAGRYMSAVKMDGRAVSQIPIRHLTSDLCREAIQQNPAALRVLSKHRVKTIWTADFTRRLFKGWLSQSGANDPHYALFRQKINDTLWHFQLKNLCPDYDPVMRDLGIGFDRWGYVTMPRTAPQPV